MIVRSLVVFTFLLSCFSLPVSETNNQSFLRAEVHDAISAQARVSKKRGGGIKPFASCSAYGNPSCSIDCPVGQAAICIPGGAFPARCRCQ